jgi:hypothetical protein
MLKTCSTCKIEKELIEFNKKKESKDGFSSRCSICLNNYSKNHYIKNKEKINNNQIIYRENNKEKIKINSNIYRENNKEKIKQHWFTNKEKLSLKQKEYYILNKEKIILQNKEYRKKNIEKSKQAYNNWRSKNKERVTQYNKIYKKDRKLTDPLFKLKLNIGVLIRNCIRIQKYSKTSKTHQILGCSFEDFKTHLQNQFTKGMSWENAGEWHLDHIYPVSLAKDEEELIRLNHYTNFQPLWAKDNLKKSNKIIDNKQLKLL